MGLAHPSHSLWSAAKIFKKTLPSLQQQLLIERLRFNTQKLHVAQFFVFKY